MTERGAVGRVFYAFANAVLARTLPTLREWLASKLGPSATVESMELDGTRVHLRNASLPIGSNATLEVDTATFVARVGEGPPLWLERLEGRFTVPGEQDSLRFCAPLVLEGQEPPTGQEWVHGLVTVDGARWTASAGRDAQAPLSGTVLASVTSSTWSLTDGHAVAAGTKIELIGSGRIDDPGRGLERASLSTDGARVGHFLDALFALSGRANAITVPLPWTGRCEGRVDLDGDAIEAAFEVRTPASRLSVDARIVSGQVERATIGGELGWIDLLPSWLASRVEPRVPVTCEASVSGPLDALLGEVRLDCPEVAVDLLREPAALSARVALCGSDGARAEATLAFVGEAGAVELSARLDADGRLDGVLEGALEPSVVGGTFGGFAGDPVRVVGTVGGVRERPLVEARASSERLLWRRGASEVALEEVCLTARFEERPALEVRARLGSGTLRLDPLARTLSAARVDAPSFVAVVRGAGITWLRRGGEPRSAARFAIPDDAEVDLELGHDEVVRGELHLATSDSRVSLRPLIYDRGRWDGSVLRGRLAARDALTCGLFPGPFVPLPEGAATLELPLFGAGADTFVDGRITTASLTWRLFEGAAPFTLSAAAAALRVDAEAVTLRGLEGSVFGGRVELDLRVAYPAAGERLRTPTGRVFVEGAREGFGAWLERLLGGARLPTGLGLDAELETGESGALRGPVVFANARSRLTLALSVGPGGDLAGTVLGGEVSLLDVYELMPRGGPTVVGKGDVEVHASIEGDRLAPEASIELKADKPRFLFADTGSGVRVALDRVEARGRLNRGRLVWSELVVDGYGGKLTSQGLFGWGSTGYKGVQAKLAIDDVLLGALPLPGGGRVGSFVTGRLNGELVLRRPATGRLSGKGQVWIDKPVFAALERAQPALEKVGLRPPPITGIEPALANVRGGAAGWILEGIGAAVRGARIDGDVALRPGGALLGKLDVSLEAAYLRSSAMLRVPATMVGDVTLPVRLGGRFRDPVIEADLLGALDHMVQKSAIGRGLHRAVDTVMDGVLRGRPGRRHERAGDEELLNTDALISQLARGTGDEDRCLDILLDRGLSPDEIADRIEAARRT